MDSVDVDGGVLAMDEMDGVGTWEAEDLVR